jgi:hypothetical protein
MQRLRRCTAISSVTMEGTMVFERTDPLGEFHARLREVEDGVFRAEYSGEINPDRPDAREILDYHVGTSAAEVKIWVEQMALGLGYQCVIWDALPDTSQHRSVGSKPHDIATGDRGNHRHDGRLTRNE